MIALLLGLLLLPALALAQPGPPVNYVSISGNKLSRYPWRGQKVVVLTSSSSLDVPTMDALVTALDEAYGVYEEITGEEPAAWDQGTLDGRDIVAEVPDQIARSGAAVSFLGFMGTEVSATYFASVYDEVHLHGELDQTLFYEFGRTFWFYGDQLKEIDAFVTGFAIANRFVAMDRISIHAGPFNQLAYGDFKSSILSTLIDTYMASSGYTWRNTLTEKDAILSPSRNPFGWGASDLAGAIFHNVYARYGFDAYKTFWRTMKKAPAAKTPEEAVRNVIAAAKSATGVDYSFVFKEVFEPGSEHSGTPPETPVQTSGK
ncbi:MAG: hypothetical protein ABSG25_10440 [Bryobacteraceae bacterium]